MTATVLQYGLEYEPGARPIGPFPNREAAIDYTNEYPHPSINPTIVTRIILTGDWAPEETNQPGRWTLLAGPTPAKPED